MKPLSLLILLSCLATAQHQTVLDPPLVGGTLPYAITLRETSFAPAPMLHPKVIDLGATRSLDP